MQELVPVVLGVLIGLALGPSPGRRAVALAAAASVVLGIAVAGVTESSGGPRATRSSTPA